MHLPKRQESICFHKELCINVRSSFIYNIRKRETMQMHSNRYMYPLIVVHPTMGYLHLMAETGGADSSPLLKDTGAPLMGDWLEDAPLAWPTLSWGRIWHSWVSLYPLLLISSFLLPISELHRSAGFPRLLASLPFILHIISPRSIQG